MIYHLPQIQAKTNLISDMFLEFTLGDVSLLMLHWRQFKKRR